MKNSKFIKLFSALLCIVMLFVSCDNGNNDPNNNNNAPKDPVELTFEDVYVNNYTPDKAAKPVSAEKFDFGELYYGCEDLALYFEYDNDHLGNMLITYTAYNYKLGKSVLSFTSTINTETQMHKTNSAFFGSYVTIDVPTMYVDYINGYEDVPVLVSSTIKAKKTSEEQKNAVLDTMKTALGITDSMIAIGMYPDDGNLTSEQYQHNQRLSQYYTAVDSIVDYLYVIHYEIYDTSGNKLAELASPELSIEAFEDYDYVSGGNILRLSNFIEYYNDDYEFFDFYGYGYYYIYVRMNDKIVALNVEDYTAVSVKDYTGQVVHVFDYENDKYGYYFDTLSSNLIQIYDKKTGELLYNDVVMFDIAQYGIYSSDCDFSYYVLNNGNVLVTVYSELERDSEKYTYYSATEGKKYLYDAAILNVENGSITSAYNGDYIIDDIVSYSEIKTWSDIYDETCIYSEKAENLASIVYINDKVMGDEAEVILDNSLNIIYKNDSAKLALEHRDYGAGEYLANGDILIDLIGKAATDKAIIKADGTFRCYVPENATILDGFILTDVAVYDYDLNLLFDFEENDCVLHSGDILFGGKFIVYYTDVAYYEYLAKVDALYWTDSDEDGTCDMYDSDYTDEIKAEYDEGGRDNTSGYYTLELVDGALTKVAIEAFEDMEEYELVIDLDSSDENLLVTYCTSSEKNSVYNVDFELLVSNTEDLYLYRCGDFYYVGFDLYLGDYDYEWVTYALNGAAHK